MAEGKFIIIDKDMDEKLGVVCNAALKNAGIDILEEVNNLINSVTEEKMENENA